MRLFKIFLIWKKTRILQSTFCGRQFFFIRFEIVPTKKISGNNPTLCVNTKIFEI